MASQFAKTPPKCSDPFAIPRKYGDNEPSPKMEIELFD
jgi:hypothetical protein